MTISQVFERHFKLFCWQKGCVRNQGLTWPVVGLGIP